MRIQPIFISLGKTLADSNNLNYTTLIQERSVQAQKKSVERWNAVQFGMSIMLKTDYGIIIMVSLVLG